MAALQHTRLVGGHGAGLGGSRSEVGCSVRTHTHMHTHIYAHTHSLCHTRRISPRSQEPISYINLDCHLISKPSVIYTCRVTYTNVSLTLSILTHSLSPTVPHTQGLSQILIQALILYTTCRGRSSVSLSTSAQGPASHCPLCPSPGCPCPGREVTPVPDAHQPGHVWHGSTAPLPREQALQ